MPHAYFILHLIILMTGIASLTTVSVYASKNPSTILVRYKRFWILMTCFFLLNFFDTYIKAAAITVTQNFQHLINIVTAGLQSFMVVTVFHLFVSSIFPKKWFPPEKILEKPFQKKMVVLVIPCAFPLIVMIISLLFPDEFALTLVERCSHIIQFLLMGELAAGGVLLLVRANSISAKKRIGHLYRISGFSILFFILINGVNLVLYRFGHFQWLLAFPLSYGLWSFLTIIYFQIYQKKTPALDRDRIAEITDHYQLTRREQEILPLLIYGLTNNEIGEKLFISKRTVDNHIANIYRKCQIKNRIELINLLTL